VIRGAAAAAAVFALAAACGGGGEGARPSQATSTSSAAPAPSSTAGTAAPAALEVSTAPWRLPAPVSREVVLRDGTGFAVLGGQDAEHISNPAAYRVDPATGTQVSVGSLDPPVHDAAGVRLGDAALVIGGGTPPARATVQMIAMPSSKVVGQLPAPRTDHVAALVDGTTYVLAGADAAEAPLADVVASADGVTWRHAGGLVEAVRYPAVAVAGGAVYLFGGVGAGRADTASVQRYDPATGTTKVVARLPAPASHASAVVLGGQVFVLGGFVGDQPSAQVLRFDPRTGEVAIAGALPAPLTDGATVVIDEIGYLVGGEGPGRATTSHVEILRSR
jgi:N-acetylneuraminic acid mutarotase